ALDLQNQVSAGVLGIGRPVVAGDGCAAGNEVRFASFLPGTAGEDEQGDGQRRRQGEQGRGTAMGGGHGRFLCRGPIQGGQGLRRYPILRYDVSLPPSGKETSVFTKYSPEGRRFPAGSRSGRSVNIECRPSDRGTTCRESHR